MSKPNKSWKSMAEKTSVYHIANKLLVSTIYEEFLNPTVRKHLDTEIAERWQGKLGEKQQCWL